MANQKLQTQLDQLKLLAEKRRQRANNQHIPIEIFVGMSQARIAREYGRTPSANDIAMENRFKDYMKEQERYERTLSPAERNKREQEARARIERIIRGL